MKITIIKNITIVNEMKSQPSDILIKGERIEKIAPQIDIPSLAIDEEINGEGKFLLPGVIDDQVHFREPGYTYKADIFSESKAAVKGGVTSYMEMPNTNPTTTTIEELKNKWNIAQKNSFANYSFYLGTNDHNLEEIKKANEFKKKICGVKIFMGSSTGGMLVDNPLILEHVFQNTDFLIATHCEKETIIKANYNNVLKNKKGNLTAKDHCIIRNEDACYESSLLAIQLAKKCNSRLHILHLSTKKETELFTNILPLKDKKITAEVCVHHLHFSADDYDTLGNKIKCNPSIKSKENREALWQALLDDKFDIIATDHAPHTLEEKHLPYLKAPAGLPLVQHPLNIMLHHAKHNKITMEKVVQKISHTVADLFRIKDRGYIREGYFADLVIVDMNAKTKVTKDSLLYKCQWSPFENYVFDNAILSTWVNGEKIFDNGQISSQKKGKILEFER